MRKCIAIGLMLSLLLIPAGVFAGQGGKKGPSDKAYEKASDKASFKRGPEQDKPGKKEKQREKNKTSSEGGKGLEGVSTEDNDDDAGRPGSRKKKGKGKP